ncbi:methyltransferase domain-containing protein [Derxia gummosa]|uniref:Methyltransferase domain-containing protein n=1 Tax=Derxia gummosa DSM 723 TaxID=1121388 RepID=A0A8B6X8C3_9BURK|nr:methyltransferase domain-containing protein [Derxia gummosa]
MNRRIPIVADRFSAAAARYDSIARAQHEAAARFADWLAARSTGDRPARIAELGCGTGFFTAHLLDRWPDATVLATDVAPAMAARCAERFADEPRLETGCADAARARFSPTPDWVVSTMCLQWVRPLEAVLDMHLSQCRVLAFSLLLDGSFAAWRDAHERAGLDCGLQPMLRADDLAALCARLAAAHGRRCEFEQVSIDEPHADGLAFARALRGIGADVARADHRPVPLRRVLAACATPLVMNYELAFVRIAP